MKLPSISRNAVEAEAARQVAFSFETLIAGSKRLQSVAFPILTANAAYCGKRVMSAYGLSVLTLENLHTTLRPAATQRLGLDSHVRVVQAVKNSPARRAGLAPGDRIVRLGQKDVGDGVKGTEQVAEILRDTKIGRALPVTILRGERELTVQLRPVAACAHPAVLAGLGDSEDIAKGGGIVVPEELLVLADRDDDLAVAVAHELGHRAAGHRRVRGDGIESILGGLPVGAEIAAASSFSLSRKPFSEKEEKVADYLGLYFAARTGFDIKNVDAFWRKASAQTLQPGGFAQIHPISAERMVLIGTTRDEIEFKRQRQAPLNPNWKAR